MMEGVKVQQDIVHHVNLSCCLSNSTKQIFSLFIRENEISINSVSYRIVKGMGLGIYKNRLTCN